MPVLVIEPPALADIEEAHDWYEARSAGLGERFEVAVDRALAWIADHTAACPEISPGVRRLLMREFPYAVFFMPFEDTIHVIAVLHSARNPDTWQGRAQ